MSMQAYQGSRWTAFLAIILMALWAGGCGDDGEGPGEDGGGLEDLSSLEDDQGQEDLPFPTDMEARDGLQPGDAQDGMTEPDLTPDGMDVLNGVRSGNWGKCILCGSPGSQSACTAAANATTTVSIVIALTSFIFILLSTGDAGRGLFGLIWLPEPAARLHHSGFFVFILIFASCAAGPCRRCTTATWSPVPE